ncbi:MAG: hypothetical protein GQ531_08640 [Sulfurovum sp.]|nr:hypothetical protein [Sulfurovum sp.]
MQLALKIFSRIVLPLLLLAYIAVETYLKLQHTSLCGEVGCKLAGELLRFNPIYLNYVGIAGSFMLMVFGTLSLKSKVFETLFFMSLYAAIAFEGTILSYQFVANPEPCIFCLGIFSSLLLIALAANYKHFLTIVAMVLAIFVGLNTLAVTKNKSFITAPGNYLIQSKTCPHCIKVKGYLKDNNIAYTGIPTTEASARSFLKFVSTKSIPVLVIKEKMTTKLITGDKAIIAHFEALKVKEVQALAPTQSTAITSTVESNSTSEDVSVEAETLPTPQTSGLPSTELSADFLSAGGDDDGCAITITETPDCEDTNKTAE